MRILPVLTLTFVGYATAQSLQPRGCSSETNALADCGDLHLCCTCPQGGCCTPFEIGCPAGVFQGIPPVESKPSFNQTQHSSYPIYRPPQDEDHRPPEFSDKENPFQEGFENFENIEKDLKFRDRERPDDGNRPRPPHPDRSQGKDNERPFKEDVVSGRHPDRPPFERPTFDGPPVEGPPMGRPPFEGPPMERPPFEGPPMERPAFEGPPMERPPFERPSMERPPFEGPPMGPAFQGPPMGRPPYEGPPMARPPFEGPPMERPAFEGPPMERPPFEGPPMNRPPIEGKFEGPPFKGVDQIQNREKRGTSSSQRNQFDGGHSMPPRGQFGPVHPNFNRQEASNEFDYSENFHPGNFEDFRGPPPHERNQRNHRFGEDKSDSQRKEQPSSFDEDEEDSFDFEFAHSSFDQQEPKSKDNYDSKKRGQHNWESRNGDPEQRARDFVEHHFMIFKIFGIGLLAYLIYRIYNAKFAKPSSQSAFVEPACRCSCSNAPQFVAIPVQQQLPPQNPIIQQQVPVLPQANSVSYQVWSPPSEDRMPLVQKNPIQMN